MSQTKTASFAEALTNIAIGFSINFVANTIALPLVGLPAPSVGQNLGIGVFMTFVSFARSFVLRRWFNGLKWGNK